jgi:hypothetical protein
VLCSDKNDAMVRITLPDENEQVLATRYQMYLPTEEELRAELEREREEAERVLRLTAPDDDSRKPKAEEQAMAEAHKWELKARVRRHAFGWKSQPAITRIKQAVAEIKKVAKKDPLLAAEGAVAFLERLSPAIEHVDNPSGSMGTAVNNAIAELVPIILPKPGPSVIGNHPRSRSASHVPEPR